MAGPPSTLSISEVEPPLSDMGKMNVILSDSSWKTFTSEFVAVPPDITTISFGSDMLEWWCLNSRRV
jgi:hypothetical protein